MKLIINSQVLTQGLAGDFFPLYESYKNNFNDWVSSFVICLSVLISISADTTSFLTFSHGHETISPIH